MPEIKISTETIKETMRIGPESHIWRLRQILNGGPGSGNFGHAGIPGQVGGSSPGGGGFDKGKWSAMSMGDRRDAWSKLSVTERDDMANASKSVPERETEHLKDIPKWENSGNISDDMHSRIDGASDKITGESSKIIGSTVDTLHESLSNQGVDPENCRDFMQKATDTLLSQEMESYERQLGDHGAHHIAGDIDRALDILDVIPEENTQRQTTQAIITSIFHDAGYQTEPSQIFLDEGHPRWSQENFDKNVASTLEDVLSSSEISAISANIRNHDSADINWKEDPTGSAVRVADNTALFAEDKLPPVFREVPENLDVLIDIKNGSVTLDEGKAQMRDNIKNSKVSDTIKDAFTKAVDESSEYTPKATLGMLGGKVDGAKWEDGHVTMYLREDKTYTNYNKILDLGQKQFGKFAESYNQDPEKFKTDLNFSFKDKYGVTQLEGRVMK